MGVAFTGAGSAGGGVVASPASRGCRARGRGGSSAPGRVLAPGDEVSRRGDELSRRLVGPIRAKAGGADCREAIGQGASPSPGLTSRRDMASRRIRPCDCARPPAGSGVRREVFLVATRARGGERCASGAAWRRAASSRKRLAARRSGRPRMQVSSARSCRVPRVHRIFGQPGDERLGRPAPRNPRFSQRQMVATSTPARPASSAWVSPRLERIAARFRCCSMFASMHNANYESTRNAYSNCA